MIEFSKFKPFDFTEGVPYISITENGITFSKGVVAKLGKPSRVELLINDIDKQFIIRACNINKICSNAFYKENSKTKYVRWNNKNLLMTIANIMDCDLSKYAYRVDGQYIIEEKAILFDLNNAVIVWRIEQ